MDALFACVFIYFFMNKFPEMPKLIHGCCFVLCNLFSRINSLNNNVLNFILLHLNHELFLQTINMNLLNI